MTNNVNEDDFAMHFAINVNTSSSNGLIPFGKITQPEEKDKGYDVKIDMGKPGIPVFIQFKSPNKISKTMKNNIENDVNLNVSEIDLYMLFLARKNFNQHNALFKTMHDNHPSLAYYCSPRFYTRQDLLSEFNNNSVHLKSALFCVEEIGPIINNDKMKRICYSINENGAVIWPIHKTIQLHEFSSIAKSANIKLNSHTKPFWKTIDEVLNNLLRSFGLSRYRAPSRKPAPSRSIKYLQLMTTQPSHSIRSSDIFHSEDGIDYIVKLKILALLVHKFLNAELYIYQSE